MRWPWSNRADDRGSGTAARVATADALAEVRGKWDEVHRVAGSLRELRERNHFVDQIELTMRPRS